MTEMRLTCTLLSDNDSPPIALRVTYLTEERFRAEGLAPHDGSSYRTFSMVVAGAVLIGDMELSVDRVDAGAAVTLYGTLTNLPVAKDPDRP